MYAYIDYFRLRRDVAMEYSTSQYYQLASFYDHANGLAMQLRKVSRSTREHYKSATLTVQSGSKRTSPWFNGIHAPATNVLATFARRTFSNTIQVPTVQLGPKSNLILTLTLNLTIN